MFADYQPQDPADALQKAVELPADDHTDPALRRTLLALAQATDFVAYNGDHPSPGVILTTYLAMTDELDRSHMLTWLYDQYVGRGKSDGIAERARKRGLNEGYTSDQANDIYVGAFLHPDGPIAPLLKDIVSPNAAHSMMWAACGLRPREFNRWIALMGGEKVSKARLEELYAARLRAAE